MTYLLASNPQAWWDRFGSPDTKVPGPGANLPSPVRWQAKAALDSPREAMAVATVNGQVYVIGGLSGGSAVADVRVLIQYRTNGQCELQSQPRSRRWVQPSLEGASTCQADAMRPISRQTL